MSHLSIEFLYDEVGSRENFGISFERLGDSGIFMLKDEDIPEVHEVCYLTPEILQSYDFHTSIDEVVKQISLDEVDLRDGWETYTTRGYCQGDIATVLYRYSRGEIATVLHKEGTILTDTIDRIFWDLMIDAHICSDDSKINEYVSLGYLDKWDPEEIYKCISEVSFLSEEDLRELKNLIPKEFPNIY